MKFSLIVTTRGRVTELEALFHSLRDQTCQDFELIIADQNEDDRLSKVVTGAKLKDGITVLKSSKGASRGRNQGLDRATGDILCFPDDDCTYPPRLLEEVAAFLEQHPVYGYLTGRSVAEDGSDSVTRYSKIPAEINRDEIHAQCVEFSIFIRRSALGGIRFDENMGVGAVTPWHSDEGPDLLLRLMEQGVRGFYNPQLTVRHPRPLTDYGPKDRDRNYRYACGNGYFYRKHHYSWPFFARQMARTLCGALLSLMCLKWNKTLFYLARLRGRWRGWKAGVAAGSTGASHS
jgi:glycosyltransferase involved in cell wall biosynthesis